MHTTTNSLLTHQYNTKSAVVVTALDLSCILAFVSSRQLYMCRKWNKPRYYGNHYRVRMGK